MLDLVGSGMTIGSYRLGEKLGAGSMGEVYAAEHVLVGRRAAVKVLHPALSANPDVVQRFFNEARAVAMISDPGVVSLLDFGFTDDGATYLVMDLLQGESLEERLERIGAFPPQDTIRIIKLLCCSLAAAHEAGIVHRDLKPENIILVGDPGVTGGERPKILDFGIAKLTAESGLTTGEGLLMGTPNYMAPEQCRGEASADHRVDVYAIGCVMFAMLTGRPPFDAATTFEVMNAHRVAPVPRVTTMRPGLPDATDAFIGRCLAKRPDNRYQSVADMVRALDKLEQITDAMCMRKPVVVPEQPKRGKRNTLRSLFRR